MRRAAPALVPGDHPAPAVRSAQAVRPWRRLCLLAPLLASLSACVVGPPRAPAYRLPPVQRPAEAPARPIFFYPERGQSEAEQDRDRYACYRWAVQQTGTDPGMTPVRQVVAPAERRRSEPGRAGDGAVLGGAVVGGALGAVVAPRHHTAEGAVLGAILGAAVGAAGQTTRGDTYPSDSYPRDSYPRDAYPPVAQGRAPVAASAALPPFRRALSACMQGRGYAVG